MLWKPIISLFERGVRDLVGYLHPAISTSVPSIAARLQHVLECSMQAV